jgi:hypothetical protein
MKFTGDTGSTWGLSAMPSCGGAQIVVVPAVVNRKLALGKFSLLTPVLGGYKLSRTLKMDAFLKALIFPAAYEARIKALDQKLF